MGVGVSLAGVYHGDAAGGHHMGGKRVAQGEGGTGFIMQDGLMDNGVWVVGSCFVANFGLAGICTLPHPSATWERCRIANQKGNDRVVAQVDQTRHVANGSPRKNYL